MFSGFVEGHFLVKNPLDRPHHGLKAMHPEGEGFVRLVVSLLLLKKSKKHVSLDNPNKEKVIKKKHEPGSETLVAHPQC